MPLHLLYFLAVASGVTALIWGADRFVSGASAVARIFGVSPLIIGLTIVSIGTSLPELLVTTTATLLDHPDVAVGNVLGSNIANIGLILGLTSLIRPLMIHSRLLAREYPFLAAVSVFAWLLSLDGQLSRLEGILLTAGLAMFLAWMGLTVREENGAAPLLEPAEEVSGAVPVRTALLWLVLGLAGLVLGSRLLIWGGVGLARAFGISELVIGLTLVAVGTSLPELATTIAGAVKREDDIAVGNVVGSNVFNTLGILGIPAILHPLPVSAAAVNRDFPLMLLATLALWPICRSWNACQGRVNRWEGGTLVAGYFFYVSFLLAA